MAVVTDALISKVVDVLVSTIAEEIRRVAGVEEEVEKLTSSLQSIQAVLVDAERRQWKEPSTVQLWLDRLRNVAYDIDDSMDTWSYEILKSQREGEETADPKSRSKVRSFKLLSVCYCFPKAVSRHHMAVKISELNARLDVIAYEKDRYNFQTLGSNIEHNRIASIVDVKGVRGRDVEKENLVSMLLPCNSEQKELNLISIVGMPGVGKTTLARLVYNDERVESHFGTRKVWVCVSDPFDETRIAKDILESLLGSKPNLDAMPNIMKEIQELVGGEEYLFVLDDVWNEYRGKWEQLKDCLRGSASKSSILVTTRKEEVGRIMGCSKSNMVRIGLLSNEASWELFCTIAFCGRSSEERESLEKVGREVVERCKGLPLAIKAIAGVLLLKEGRSEWQSVLDSELWSREEFQKDIAAPLWLSYYDLPSPLKQCFSYCAVFPKDYKMEKYKLINHWIAQGYIQTQLQNKVRVGEEYFQNLVTRSFFQDVEVSGFEITCKLHDIVHDFAQLLVKKECHSIELNHVNEEISLNDDSFAHSLCHLSVIFKKKVKCPGSFYNLKKLRSLIFSSSWRKHNSSFFGLDLKQLFNVFTLLRSLVLSDCGIGEVPSNINKLIHLRELDLSCNFDLVELPDTMWELYNLQILNLRFTEIRQVKGIGRLSNLSYLDIDGTKCSLPKEMVRLSSLTTLHSVNIDVNNEEALSLKHLKNFNQLTGSLIVRWLERGDGDVEDAKHARLMDKKYITRLELCFGSKEEESRGKHDEELVEALNMPPNVESLGIEDYMGSRTPKWLYSVTFVKTVELVCWRNVEHLPPLGKLPFLENLYLSRLHRVVKVGAEFFGMDLISTNVPFFPKLKSLSFSDFEEWEEWNDMDVERGEEIMIMPFLTSLNIEECPKLKALPNFILKKTSLQLVIFDCDAL